MKVVLTFVLFGVAVWLLPVGAGAAEPTTQHTEDQAERAFLRRTKSKFKTQAAWVDGCNRFDVEKFDCSGSMHTKRYQCLTSGTVEWVDDELFVNVGKWNCKKKRRR